MFMLFIMEYKHVIPQHLTQKHNILLILIKYDHSLCIDISKKYIFSPQFQTWLCFSWLK